MKVDGSQIVSLAVARSCISLLAFLQGIRANLPPFHMGLTGA